MRTSISRAQADTRCVDVVAVGRCGRGGGGEVGDAELVPVRVCSACAYVCLCVRCLCVRVPVRVRRLFSLSLGTRGCVSYVWLFSLPLLSLSYKHHTKPRSATTHACVL